MNEKKEWLSFRAKTIIVLVLVAIAVVVAIAFNVINATGFLYNGLTAVDVNGSKYTAADFNFYYMYSYSRYYDYMQSMVGEDSVAQFMPTNGTPFREQVINEETGETWYDNLKNMTIDNLKELTDLRDRAVAAGYTLSDEQKAQIESDISEMKTQAENTGLDFKTFLRYYYGNGMTEKILRRNLELYYMTQGYTADIYEGFTFTDEEVNAEYTENKDSYDYYSFYAAFIPASADTEREENETDEAYDARVQEAEESAKSAAKETADAIAAEATDLDSFISSAIEHNAQVSPYVAQGSDLTEEYRTWLSDSARANGDVDVFESTDSNQSGYYVFMFTERDDNNYNSVNAAYIEVSVDTPAREEDETDEAYEARVQEAQTSAETTANDINAAWQSGEYETFSALSEAFTGSFSTADTYSQAGRNDVSESFVDWLFSDERKDNDSTVIEGSSTYYVLIYLNEDEPLRTVLAQDALTSAATSEWSSAVGEGYTATEKYAMRYTGGIWYENISQN